MGGRGVLLRQMRVSFCIVMGGVCRGASRRNGMKNQNSVCDVLVVAKFAEQTEWTRGMATEVKLFTKKLGNVGRESHSYVKFVIEEHRSRKANRTRVCFTQGSADGWLQREGEVQRPSFLTDAEYEPIFGAKKIGFDTCGQPNDCLPCLAPIARAVGISPPNSSHMGAFFSTTLGTLRRIPIEVWWFLYNLHYTHPSCRVPHVLERLWESLLRASAPRIQHTTIKPAQCKCAK